MRISDWSSDVCSSDLKEHVMSRKTKSDTTGQPAIPTELIDYFVKGPMTAEAVEDASAAFKKALIERAMGAELSHHLGYWPGTARPVQASDWRNGKRDRKSTRLNSSH